MQINNSKSSPNFDDRPIEEDGSVNIDTIIIHYTEIDLDQTLHKFLDPEEKVSAHFVIDKNGELYSLVNVYKRAWHAGLSYWQGKKNLNDNSIGIELVNNGQEPFSVTQMDVLISLLKILKRKFNIKKQNILGHSDIAPSRKVDPGIFFDWELLAHNHLAVMPARHNIEDNKILYKFGDSGISILQDRLKLLGYNINISNEFDLNTAYVINAFKIRFMPHIFTSNQIITEDAYWDLESDLILDEVLKQYKIV